MKSLPVAFERTQRYGIEPDVYKIAFLRSNAIGDFIFSLPALEALRHAYPYAEIVLLGLGWHADFLRGRPGPVDRVEVIPHMEGLHLFPGQQTNPEEVEAFFQRMQAEEFDLAIQAHGGGRNSNPLIKPLGARLTLGARTPDAELLDRWIPYTLYQVEILRQLEIVSLAGAKPISLAPRLEVTNADLEEAGQLAPPSASPTVVIHPGAGDPRRRWPAKNFAFVGDALAGCGARIVLVGNQAQRDLTAEVAGSMAFQAIDLGGRTTLGGLAGLMSRADLVISNDSGPRHLAGAVGTPTVGIYWVGNVIAAAPVSQARHRLAVSWQIDCPVCGLDCMKHDCGHGDSFVTDVSKTEVVNLAFELLEMEPERSK